MCTCVLYCYIQVHVVHFSDQLRCSTRMNGLLMMIVIWDVSF